jgi:5-methylcytosine-specific restriction enzyme subunit McrC
VTLLRLREAGPAREAPLTGDQARRLVAAGIVEVRPGAAPGTWMVRAERAVGAARVSDVELRIEPKVPVARLLFLLGYARDPVAWREESVGLSEHPELVSAIAATLWRQVDRALRGGLLYGYREVEETASVLRGRLRETDQLGRRFGAPLPLEIRHDEFTVDIPENRILATALDRMLHVPGVDAPTRAMLRHESYRFVDVTRLHPGQRSPDWRPSRLNARYHLALRLAELVLSGTSMEAGLGRVTANGFLVDMPRVFEDFLSVSLQRSITTRYGGAVTLQAAGHLDIAHRIGLRPDLLWRRSGRDAAVIDAKYKAYTPAADAYQMLAYCTVYGLHRGHLVYVTGEHLPIRHVIRNAGTEIVCHALDLGLPAPALLTRVDQIADDIAVPPARTEPLG